jgi:hypothetical protein
MSVFIRRFLSDPGNEVLLDIESVNVLDLEPPSTISGVGTGTVLLVGEFENGAFNAPTEIASSTDLMNSFGVLGYEYGGVPSNNPCARSRKADGALAAEYWNGNGFVQLNAKRFRRLLLCRVDTSVGTVEFRRQAFVTGLAAFTYNMEPAQVLQADVGAGQTSATFSATAATVTTAAGTYPSGFVGGETLTLGYDGIADFTVTFLPADQSIAQVIARINVYAGFAFAAAVSATTFSLTGRQRGNAGKVRVVSASAGVLAALGLTVATTLGTGNVANIDAVSFLEIKTVVEAAISDSLVEQDSIGRLRLSKVFAASGDYVTIGTATTATALGFTAGQTNSNDGRARMRSGTGTYPTTFVGGETLTLAVDDLPEFTVTFVVGDQAQADVITAVNAAAGYTLLSSVSATVLLFTGVSNGGKVQIVAASPLVLTALGITLSTAQAGGVSAGTIAAGNELTNTAGTKSFVTMQSVAVTVDPINGAGGVGPYTVKVRHSLDDGTGTSATAGTIVKVLRAPDLGSFDVVNPQLLTAALTESAIDAAYTTAIDATLNLNSEARIVNVMYAARQSNAVRRALRVNAIQASAIGMYGRMACIRPPMKTTRAQAKSNTAEPGVGAYRDQRVIYTYPGAASFVPLIGRRGTGGGAGFTADGIVDIGADGFMASILSQLAPEENPGQETPFAGGIVSLEKGNTDVQNLEINDYIAFKAAGIAALRMDDGTAIFQSGVTSVDPSVNPGLKNIARRRMADFIQDSLARRCKAFGKKLSTSKRRRAIALEVRGFLENLLNQTNPDSQRIAGYTLDASSGNSPDTLALGLYRLVIKVRTLASLDSIVLETTIGESVEVAEQLPAAA